MTRYFTLIATAVLWLTFIPNSAAAQEQREIQFSADQVDFDEVAERIRLVGDVVIRSEGLTLTAPYAEYSTVRQTADFQGGVQLTGEATTATAREMVVDYARSTAVLKGSVRIVSEASMGSEQSEPTVLLSERLEYDWLSQEGAATGGVRMRQGTRRAFADRAELYQRRNEVWLIGNVRVEQPGGDWLTAQRAVYDSASQNVRADGRVVARTTLISSSAEEPEGTGEESLEPQGLPAPLVEPPAFRMMPMRELPVLPLPWLDR